MIGKCLAVIGASSFVGEFLLPILEASGRTVIAYSREATRQGSNGVEWWTLESSPSSADQGLISDWICVAPIWVLSEYFNLLKSCGAKRVVALSSTSLFSKVNSSDRAEQALAAKLAEAEMRFSEWAEGNGVEWLILRPTLIYGRGRDRNISEIASFIRRFRFFPIIGGAVGLRQPVHVEDVAVACSSAMESHTVKNRAYNLSGGEILTYPEMVKRVFRALGCRPRVLPVPRAAFQVAVLVLRRLPRYKSWSMGMVDRMNIDLVFDHSDAEKELGFLPRGFSLGRDDLPER